MERHSLPRADTKHSSPGPDQRLLYQLLPISQPVKRSPRRREAARQYDDAVISASQKTSHELLAQTRTMPNLAIDADGCMLGSLSVYGYLHAGGESKEMERYAIVLCSYGRGPPRMRRAITRANRGATCSMLGYILEVSLAPVSNTYLRHPVFAAKNIR